MELAFERGRFSDSWLRRIGSKETGGLTDREKVVVLEVVKRREVDWRLGYGCGVEVNPEPGRDHPQ